MRTQQRKYRNRLCYCGLLVMLLTVAGFLPMTATAQQSTATVNGTVVDPSGAAVVNAQVELTNVNT